MLAMNQFNQPSVLLWFDINLLQQQNMLVGINKMGTLQNPVQVNFHLLVDTVTIGQMITKSSHDYTITSCTI